MVHFDYFFTSHPLAVLAVSIILEQAGIPIASAPLLLLIGALAGSAALSGSSALLVAVSTCVLADSAWFELGRIRRLTHSRSCTAWKGENPRPFRIPNKFVRHGSAAIFVARFLPGPNFAAAIAGYSRVSRAGFLVKDTVASCLWATFYLTAGNILPQNLRAHICSFVSATPRCAIYLPLALIAAILVGSLFRRQFIQRSTRRLANLPRWYFRTGRFQRLPQP